MKRLKAAGQLAIQPICYPQEVRLVICTRDGGRELLKSGSWPAIRNSLPAPMEVWSVIEVEATLSRGEEANLGVRFPGGGQ